MLAAAGSFLLSIVIGWTLAGAVLHPSRGHRVPAGDVLGGVVALIASHAHEKDFLRTDDVGFSTSASFETGALGMVALLVALYAAFW